MSAKKKLIASLCALIIAVSAAAGSVFAWLSVSDYTAPFRMGFAKLSVAGSFGAQSFFVRSEGDEAEAELFMARGETTLKLENATTEPLSACFVVSGAAIAQAKAAHVKLTIDEEQFDFAELTDGMEFSPSLGGIEPGAEITRAITLVADEGFVLDFAVRVY